MISFSTTSRGDAVKNLMLLVFLLPLLLLLFSLVAAPPSCELLPPLGAYGALCAPSLGGVLRMYPSMLRWTFGVLYVELAFFA